MHPTFLGTCAAQNISRSLTSLTLAVSTVRFRFIPCRCALKICTSQNADEWHPLLLEGIRAAWLQRDADGRETSARSPAVHAEGVQASKLRSQLRLCVVLGWVEGGPLRHHGIPERNSRIEKTVSGVLFEGRDPAVLSFPSRY